METSIFFGGELFLELLAAVWRRAQREQLGNGGGCGIVVGVGGLGVGEAGLLAERGDLACSFSRRSLYSFSSNCDSYTVYPLRNGADDPVYRRCAGGGRDVV